MSDSVLRFVPADRLFVPSEAASERAVARVRAVFAAADEVRAVVSQDVELVDPGGNMGSVGCPLCGAPLDEWWCEVMTAERLRAPWLEAPCCGSTICLDGLRYEWPVAFARYALQVLNPGRDPSPAEVMELESLLGCALRLVRAHY